MVSFMYLTPFSIIVCRKDIMDAYIEEKKKALQYMAASKSRVAITSDMWTSDNQKRGLHGYNSPFH
jgi:hypothetical protein